jgi:hypothetical protein
MVYNCKNRDFDFEEWICVCPQDSQLALVYISKLNNSWAIESINLLKKKANLLSEDQAILEIKKIENEINHTYAMWRNCL